MGVKAILLACNTISSLIESLDANVPLFSIVEAGCLATIERQKEGAVGLIATTATVKNGTYEHILSSHTQALRYITQGTRTLANVINNHPGELALLRQNIKEAIDPIFERERVSALLLGCTHFPIVRKTIEEMYPCLSIIDPADKQITLLKEYLEKNNAFNESKYAGVTRICATGGEKDYRIFENMIEQLALGCSELTLEQLDIDE